MIVREEQKCNESLDTGPSARQAFTDRQAKLIQLGMAGCVWPLTRWYNDEDFCRAYNQICRLTDEVERLKAELAVFKEAFPGARVTRTGTLLILSDAAEAARGES